MCIRDSCYTIIPDQIEAGTYMVAAAATGGEVLVKNVIPKHLECISAKLRETGTIVQEYEDSVLVKGASTLRRANIKTLPYPCLLYTSPAARSRQNTFSAT